MPACVLAERMRGEFSDKGGAGGDGGSLSRSILLLLLFLVLLLLLVAEGGIDLRFFAITAGWRAWEMWVKRA